MQVMSCRADTLYHQPFSAKPTHKDVEWCWSDVQERAWDEVRSLIALIESALVLSYYKPVEPLQVQRDSSQAGLGAAPIKDVRSSIAYASRALAPTETRYAQMEKEMIAIVFAVEKFNDYTFDNKNIVFSGHKL